MIAGTGRWSPSLWELLGMPPQPDAPPLHRWMEWVHPDDHAPLRASYAAALRGERTELTFRVIPPDGRERVLRTQLFRGSTQNEHLVCGVVEDITVARQSERVSQTALQMFRAAIEAIPEALVIRAPDGRTLWHNQAYRELFGRSEAEVAASRLDAFIEPDDLPPLRAWHRAIDRTGRVPIPPVMRAVRPDGSVRYWEPVPAGDVVVGRERVGRILVGRDVTDRILLERSLAERSADFEAIFEAAPRGMVVIDETGAVLRCNQGAREMFGWQDEDLVGQHVSVLADGISPSEHDRYLRHYIETGRASTPEGLVLGRQREVWARRRDGTPFRASLTVAELPAHSGRRRFLGVAFDLTERNAREEQVRILQKNEALGTLVAGVAHDFNNLLTVIAGALHMTQGGAGTRPGELARWMEMAIRASDQAGQLVRQLLEFARPGNATSTPVNFMDVVQETVRLLRETGDRRVTFSVECLSVVPTVTATPSGAQQLLMNLLMNARDAVLERLDGEASNADGARPVDGLVRVTLRTAPDDPSQVLISVEDNGTGVPAEIRTRVFDPFFTTKAPGQGTGLGLSTVLTLVRQLGGTIRCDASSLGGALFEVRLPVSDATQTHVRQPEAPDRPAARPLAGVRALLVDDHADVRAFTHAVLEQAGADVTVASSAPAALAILPTLDPGVVIFDINMPGMTGWEFLVAAREIAPQARLVVLSGYVDEELAARHRPHAVVMKPCTPEQVIAAAAGVG